MPKHKHHPPPIPPAERSDKGPGGAPDAAGRADLTSDAGDARRRNIDKQGRQGNIAASTRNQGFQQDR